MRYIRPILKIWGGLCILIAIFYSCLAFYAAVNPYSHFDSGVTPLGAWIGMGLISLGLARVIELLEKK